MVEYEINQVGYTIEVSGPWCKWLHVRLMAFPGCQFDKETKVWTIAKCRSHLVEIVIKTHLNNLSRDDPDFQPEFINDDWMENGVELPNGL